MLVLHTNDGYGRGYGNTKYFPFMDNFYGGGIDTVPGFDPNTLGPYDKWGNSLGGNELVSYGVDLVFPNPIGHMVRTSLTINGGNVYNQMIQNNPGLNPIIPNKTWTKNQIHLQEHKIHFLIQVQCVIQLVYVFNGKCHY